MASAQPRLPVRTSAALRGLIDEAGPVNAATRALLVLGAAAAGLDTRSVEREVYALLAARDLDPRVRGALECLLRGVTPEVVSPVVSPVTPATAPAVTDLLGDLLGVGIEV